MNLLGRIFNTVNNDVFHPIGRVVSGAPAPQPQPQQPRVNAQQLAQAIQNGQYGQNLPPAQRQKLVQMSKQVNGFHIPQDPVSHLFSYLGRNFIGQPAAEIGATVTGKTFHPGNRLEKAIVGNTPVKPIQQDVRGVYQAVKSGNQTLPGNIPIPQNLAPEWAAANAVLHIGNDLPLVGGVTKGVKVAAPTVAKVVKPAAEVAMVPKAIRMNIKDQQVLKDFADYRAGAYRPPANDLNQLLRDARAVGQKHGVDLVNGTPKDHIERAAGLLDQLGAKNRQIMEGGYAKIPGKSPQPVPEGKLPVSGESKAVSSSIPDHTELNAVNPRPSETPILQSKTQLPVAQELPKTPQSANPLAFDTKAGPVASNIQDSALPQSSQLRRRDLSGMALSTHPSKIATPEEIGQALGMSPEQIKAAQTSDPLGQLPGLKSRVQGKTINRSIADNMPELENDLKGHPSYDVRKKVNPIDTYLRTPEKVLQKIGLGHVAQDLKAADHAYKQELPKEIDRIKSWRKEVNNDPEASKRIFQYLDGQKGAEKALQGNEKKVAGEIKDYLKKWADRLNLPEDKRISNYITHIFDEKLLMKEFDPELEKLIQDKVPGSVYDPFTLQRLGAKGYKEDAFLALQAYVKRGVRKANMDPALEKLANESQGLDVSGLNYVKRYGDRINMRPTDVDKNVDILIKQSPIGYKLGQRPVAKISHAIRQATYRATLGLNLGSAVRNLTQGINTFAELGSKWTTKGYYDMLRNFHSDELQRTGVLDNSFVEDQTLSAFKQGMQKVDQGLFAFFEGAEKVNRGAAYYGAKAKALSEGKSLDEAVKAGVNAAEKTQFKFGAVNTPVGLQSDVAKLLTQFQSYNVKQVEFIGDMVKNREFRKLLRYAGATAVVFGTVGEALGYNPSDMLPFGSNVTDGKLPIGNTPAFRIGSSVKSLVNAATAPQAPNSKTSKSDKVTRKVLKLGSDVGSATIPGFVQGKKTVTGIRAVNKGEVQQGNKTIQVDKTKQNYAKAALFGPYTLKGQTKTQAKQSAAPGGTKKGGGYTKKEASGLSTDPNVKWAGMTAKAKDNVARVNPNKYIQRQTEQIQKDLSSGKITESKAFKEKRDVQKVTVYSNYDKNTVDAYKLPQTDFNAYLSSASPDTINKLKALDQKLLDQGLIAKSKFPKIKVAKAKGTGKGRRTSTKTASTKSIKFSVPKTPKLSKFSTIKMKHSKTAKFKVASLGGKPKKIKIA